VETSINLFGLLYGKKSFEQSYLSGRFVVSNPLFTISYFRTSDAMAVIIQYAQVGKIEYAYGSLS